MICMDCIYHIYEWRGDYNATSTGGLTLHHFCNNPTSEYYNKEVNRYDECENGVDVWAI